MNIFFTDPDPVKCAEYLDNKRVVKMVLESCQMLATAINETGGKAPYKSTHKNHPSNVWVRESYDNFMWLWEHMVALSDEYERRYGKKHKSYLIFTNSDILVQAQSLLPKLGLTSKPNCAANQDKGISYKHISDIYTAYKLYLNDRWETDTNDVQWS